MQSAPKFGMRQAGDTIQIIVGVPNIVEASVVLRVTRRYFSVRFRARGADGETAYELCSEVGSAAAGQQVSKAGSTFRVSSLNAVLVLKKASAGSGAAAAWPEDVLPTARSAEVALAAAIKSELKQAQSRASAQATSRSLPGADSAEGAAPAPAASAPAAAQQAEAPAAGAASAVPREDANGHARTWRLRPSDLGVCSDAAPTACAPAGRKASANGEGAGPGGPSGNGAGGGQGGGQLVPSVTSLFPTDPLLLSRLQIVRVRGCGLIDTDIQALCKCLSAPPSPASSERAAPRALGACPELTTLELSSNQLSSAALPTLSALLVQRAVAGVQSSRCIQTLDLAYNQIGQVHAAPSASARRRKAGSAGDAAGRGREPKAGGSAPLGCTGADGATGLKRLSIAGNELCAVSLGACLSALCPGASGLDLDCSNCGLAATDLPILLTLELGALRLDDNVLVDVGVAQLAQTIAGAARGPWAGLRLLSLCNVSAGEAGVARLAEALRKSRGGATAAPPGVRNAGQLRTLDLRHNHKLGESARAALHAVAAEDALLELLVDG